MFNLFPGGALFGKIFMKEPKMDNTTNKKIILKTFMTDLKKILYEILIYNQSTIIIVLVL